MLDGSSWITTGCLIGFYLDEVDSLKRLLREDDMLDIQLF